MAAKTDAQLLTDANVIKSETTPGANSATRVGNMLIDAIDSKLNIDYGTIKTKIVTITNWNMDTTVSGVNSKTVAHGLGADFSKIRSISVLIVNDAGTEFRPLPTIDPTVSGTNNALVGGILNIDSTNITLSSFGASSINFANTNYDGTGTRGYIKIEYAP